MSSQLLIDTYQQQQHGVLKMKDNTYKILLLKKATGETREIVMDGPWDEGTDYQWMDGNYSCDCNRHYFFDDAGDPADDTDEDVPCGEVLYRALSVELPNGVTLALEQA